MSERTLIEYSYNEITETGEFTYTDSEDWDDLEKMSTETRPQPLTVQTFDSYESARQQYWGELLWYLRTQEFGEETTSE